MRFRSSRDRYGAVAIAIHWLTALAVIGLLASGLAADAETDPDAKADLLRVHAPMGIAVLVLTLARILWWLLADRHPDPASPRRLERWAASFVHLAFYPLLIALAASGIAMLALSGAAEVLFFGAARPLPDFREFAPRGPHGLFAWVLIALVIGHVAAALYHQFARKDGLLARMGLFAWPKS